MRRPERQVTDPEQIRGILDRARVLFLALHDEPAPYVVPLFFGHEDGRLYVHSALSGTKVDLLRVDPRVGFSAAADLLIVEGKDACSFTARGESVAGSARARVVETEEERLHGLDLIMRHYTTPGAGDRFSYRPTSLSRMCVIALEIITILGKRIGEPTG